MVLRNFIFVPVTVIRLLIYAAHKERYTDEQKLSLLKDIVHRAHRSGNIELICTGTENLPEEGGYIMFPNHQGMYDVLAIMEHCPRLFGVIMKQELKDIPILKSIFTLLGAIAIDRDDVRQGMMVINQVAEEVKQGRAYLIFPEGTRSKNGNHMGEFKPGCFKSAMKSKCPIVPVALIDCNKAFDTGSVEQITTQVHFLPAISYEEYKGMKTIEIASLVKNRIQEKMDEVLTEEENREEENREEE